MNAAVPMGPGAPAAGLAEEGGALLPEETPVALVYHGVSQAVMMATPVDLEDLAVGFTLTEGFAETPAEIGPVERVDRDAGIELRIELSRAAGDRLAARRRAMAGPVGCGLCGIESLEAAARPLPPLPPGPAFPAALAGRALGALGPAQVLGGAARGFHAAGFWRSDGGPDGGLVALREDVGRHNALDKLIGALARGGEDVAGGAALLSSRVSLEMAQKCVMAGIAACISASAPTGAAARAAAAAGLGLMVRGKGGGFARHGAAARFALDGDERAGRAGNAE